MKVQIRVRPDIELIDAKTISAALNDLISPPLSELGLLWRGDYVWADPGDVDLRRVVQLVPLKGLGAVVRWGYSLSFVPRPSGSRLAYHRSFKAARLDVFEWPDDYAKTFGARAQFEKVVLVRGKFEATLRPYFNARIPEVFSWFNRVHDLDGIERELRQQASITAWAYRIRDPSPGYVLPFVVASLGNLSEAQKLADVGFSKELDAKHTALRGVLELIAFAKR